MKKQVIRHKMTFVCLVFAFILPACSGNGSRATSYEFTEIRRDTLERTVTSTGTINPIATVRVLPQMSGKVERIFVDFNDVVRRGDILAELNTDMLRLRREQQHASVLKARANHELQLVIYNNQRVLAERNLISEFELLSSRTTLNNLAADLAVAEANFRAIETEINQFAFITSPIDGIVLDRRINIGDTVVDSSSNNSSNMFTLAENLSEMQIEALVGELDIVAIQSGQAVRFTLESLPGRSFNGQVEAVRKTPVVSNNVVSYMVIIKVENLDGSLLPGMTCAVEFIVERSEDVLMVSNAALRYQPTTLSEERIAEMVFNASLANLSEEQRLVAIETQAQARAQNAAQATNQNANSGLQNLMMGGQQNTRMIAGSRQPTGGARQSTQAQGRNAPAAVMRNLWYINGEGNLEVMQVQVGISSGSFTEILNMEDIEGKRVILRERIL